MGVRLARSDFNRKRDIQFYGNKQFQLNVRVCFPSAFEKYKQQLTYKRIQQPYWKKKNSILWNLCYRSTYFAVDFSRMIFCN